MESKGGKTHFITVNGKEKKARKDFLWSGAVATKDRGLGVSCTICCCTGVPFKSCEAIIVMRKSGKKYSLLVTGRANERCQGFYVILFPFSFPFCAVCSGRFAQSLW